MSFFPIIPPVTSTASVAYISSAVDTTDASSYTFSSKSFGSVSSDRYIIVCVNGRAGSDFTFTSVTIGGVTATAVATATGARCVSAIYIAAVPTGATGSIVVTPSTTLSCCGVGWYRAEGLSSATPYTTSTDTTDTSNAYSVSINVPVGFLVASCFAEDNVSRRTCTWTGASENFDDLVEDGGPRPCMSGASNSYAAAATSQTVSAQWSGSFDRGGLAVATWS